MEVIGKKRPDTHNYKERVEMDLTHAESYYRLLRWVIEERLERRRTKWF